MGQTTSTTSAITATRKDIYRPEVLQTIAEELDQISPQLRKLSLTIHGNAELGFEEKYAHDTLTEFMETNGFEVTRQYKKDFAYHVEPTYMTTAWRAVYEHTVEGSQVVSRTLGVNSEMDGLPIPFGQVTHACGHNLIAIAGVAVALAVKKALKTHNVPGRIVLLGTPAEEGGQGKVRLIAAGAYEGMDACVMAHPGAGPTDVIVVGSSLAFQAFTVTFRGKPAHAALAPWEGINAQDAVMLSYNAISMLRQQLHPAVRVHGVVMYQETPLASNVIPEEMSMVWNIRAPTKDELESLRDRVIACFEGAATATGCTLTTSFKDPDLNLVQNPVLGDEFASTCVQAFDMFNAPAADNESFSTDFGNVTYELPAIHPGYTIPSSPNGSPHTPEFAHAAGTQEGHDQTLKIAKALALTGFRVLDDEKFCREAKEAFETSRKGKGRK